MSDLARTTEQAVEFEPIDGVHELRQRRSTRLWYRTATTQTVRTAPVRPALAVEPEAPAAAPKNDQLAEIARMAIAAGRKASAISGPPSAPDRPDRPEQTAPEAGWRTVPESCPALMLSASATLGGQVSDGCLVPGARFRVLSALNGVAEIEVVNEGGKHARGYCNTVDLACVDAAYARTRHGLTKRQMPKVGRFKLPGLGQALNAR